MRAANFSERICWPPPLKATLPERLLQGPIVFGFHVPEQRRAARWLDSKERSRGLRPRDAAYLIVVVWLVAVVIFGIVEHLIDDQTFPTVWLGMWWALTTVTTVGYGDVVPQDPVGRVVASFLLLGGLALISVVTATVTSGFVARAQRENPSDAEKELLGEVRALRAQVEELAARPDRRPPPSG